EIADGIIASGDWIIRAASAGTYRFEVRRWPREADAELAGVPAIHKTEDSWAFHGPNRDLLYGNARGTSFKKLPVASVRLTVGEKTQTLPAAAGTKEISFDIQLTTDRSYSVKAELLDPSGKVITGGYYVYCRRESH
ncbi:MAG: sulfatase, partial [bacterium]